MKTILVASSVASLLLQVAIQADTLEFKNGQVVQGTYLGGTAQTLRFQTRNGTKDYQRNEVLALTLAGPGDVGPESSGAGGVISGEATSITGAGATAPRVVTLPAGTPLHVRMGNGVNSATDKPGKKFTAILESNLLAEGRTVAPAGTTVHGQLAQVGQAERLPGHPGLRLMLTDMVLNGESKPVSTSQVSPSDQASKAGGGIADAGQDAGTVALGKGESISVPPGSLLEFTLSQPMSIRIAQ